MATDFGPQGPEHQCSVGVNWVLGTQCPLPQEPLDKGQLQHSQSSIDPGYD